LTCLTVAALAIVFATPLPAAPPSGQPDADQVNRARTRQAELTGELQELETVFQAWKDHRAALLSIKSGASHYLLVETGDGRMAMKQQDLFQMMEEQIKSPYGQHQLRLRLMESPEWSSYMGRGGEPEALAWATDYSITFAMEHYALQHHANVRNHLSGDLDLAVRMIRHCNTLRRQKQDELAELEAVLGALPDGYRSAETTGSIDVSGLLAVSSQRDPAHEAEMLALMARIQRLKNESSRSGQMTLRP
jgi:hypothetical protein